MKKPLLVLALAALFSCTLASPSQGLTSNQMTDPERSLIFGYIDMTASRQQTQWISLFQALPKTENIYRNNYDWRGGLFYFEDLLAGSYQLGGFGGNGFSCEFRKYGRNKTAMRIGAGGIYFMGAYRYLEDSGFLTPGSLFDIEPLTSPSERELLAELARQVEGSSWEPKVKARLAELTQ